jgi:hypothetical protein
MRVQMEMRVTFVEQTTLIYQRHVRRTLFLRVQIMFGLQHHNLIQPVSIRFMVVLILMQVIMIRVQLLMMVVVVLVHAVLALYVNVKQVVDHGRMVFVSDIICAIVFAYVHRRKSIKGFHY